MQMQIRRMTERDVSQAAALEAANFTTPWSEKSFYEQLEKSNALYMVAEREGHIIGVCGLVESYGEAEIYNVSVDSNYRRRGVGTLLMRELLAEGSRKGISAYTLEVRAGNEGAIYLYEKLGFMKEGLRRGFYDRPREDAVIMWKR